MRTARSITATTPVGANRVEVGPAVDEVGRLSGLAMLLLDDRRVQAVLDQIASAALRWCRACAIAVEIDDRVRTVASAGDLAGVVQLIQDETDHAPALTALRYGEVCYLPDLSVERRWPAFARRALHAGVRAVLALPVRVGRRVLGSVNLYADAVHAFPAGTRRAVDVLAPLAGIALEWGDPVDRSGRDAGLRSCLEERSSIDQALGILMAQNSCGVDEAYALLREMARYYGLSLGAVAQHHRAALAWAAPDGGGPWPSADGPGR